MSAAKFVGYMYYVEPGQDIWQVADEAMEAYRARFGRPAAVCYVNPSQPLDAVLTQRAVVVMPSAYVMPGYVYVGEKA
jgi:hypothetical protein